MNIESKEYMLKEYDRISTAYFGLRDQVNEYFKSYITLVGIPLTVLAAVMKFSEGKTSIKITNLPDFIAGLLIVVGILGLFISLSIINMRMEMILYARTINGVRRFFGAKDQSLLPFLVLPTTDTKPPHYEPSNAIFWQVVMIGILDGIIFGVASVSLFNIGILLSITCGVLFGFFHWLVYWLISIKREKEYKVHFPTDLP